MAKLNSYFLDRFTVIKLDLIFQKKKIFLLEYCILKKILDLSQTISYPKAWHQLVPTWESDTSIFPGAIYVLKSANVANISFPSV